MSQVKLTLRPPPNVDFVHGYPGIPPGNDRPQALVKGAIEVRTPPAGVKAKFVRIELRKVETLPGGGPSNTFFDYVGPSPVNLWTSSDDYSILRAQDFPFSIRIPESIPPSIALDNKAGIHYELVATVCTKGKRGFLRRRKSVVVTEIAQVIIDKHELHSTWPVYCQPETRQIAQDGMTLIAERNHTCYGPGDRIAVIATLKSDIVHTVVLRGFEMTLKETSIFRASPYGNTRRGAPEVRVLNVAETKAAIHATLYGGATHKAELSCALPPNHTTTTLNAARHIDVAYVLSVKAVLSTGANITIDLPVMISNWQRHVSQEAIRRIGTVPSLSLQTAPSLNTPVNSPIMAIQPSNSISSRHTTLPAPASPIPATSTLPASPHGKGLNHFHSLTASNISRPINNTIADEFGYGTGYKSATTHHKSNSRDGHDDVVNSYPANAGGVGSVSTYVSRPGGRLSSPGTSTSANRFTIMNAEPDYIDESPTARNPATSSASPSNTARTTAVQSQTPQKQWPTAEEEKRAYEMARARVAEVQGVASAPPPVSSSPSPHAQNKTTTPTSSGRNTSASNKPWLSAEEEKVLLYEKAQAAVLRAQREAAAAEQKQHASASGSSSKSTASEVYQQAMSNIKSTPSYTSALSGSSSSRKQQSTGSGVPQYLSAEQEKAALKRYEEAKKAVDRVHNNPNYVDAAAPIAYDSLYPAAGGSGSHAPVDAPPSFEASVSPAATAAPMTALAEKERLRKAYETQDTIRSQQASPPPAFTPSTPSAAPPSFNASATVPPNTAQQYKDAAAEKEALRKKFEQRDAQAAAAAKKQMLSPAVTPPVSPLVPGSRPIPTPPSTSNTKILTAADEKALVKAKRDAKDAKVQKKLNGTTPNGRTTERHDSGVAESNETTPLLNPQDFATQRPVTPPPPPLMPRPPVEYIQETQEEDARVSKFAIDGASINLEEGEDEYSHGVLTVNKHVLKVPGPPPPLPPKPAVE